MTKRRDAHAALDALIDCRVQNERDRSAGKRIRLDLGDGRPSTGEALDNLMRAIGDAMHEESKP